MARDLRRVGSNTPPRRSGHAGALHSESRRCAGIEAGGRGNPLRGRDSFRTQAGRMFGLAVEKGGRPGGPRPLEVLRYRRRDPVLGASAIFGRGGRGRGRARQDRRPELPAVHPRRISADRESAAGGGNEEGKNICREVTAREGMRGGKRRQRGRPFFPPLPEGMLDPPAACGRRRGPVQKGLGTGRSTAMRSASSGEEEYAFLARRNRPIMLPPLSFARRSITEPMGTFVFLT